MTVVRFACSACGKRLKAASDLIGTTCRCPNCGQRQWVPPPVRVRPLAQAVLGFRVDHGLLASASP